MYLVVYIYTLFLLIYISFRIFHDLIVCKVLKLVKYLLNYYYIIILVRHQSWMCPFSSNLFSGEEQEDFSKAKRISRQTQWKEEGKVNM